MCRFSDAGNDETLDALGRPASEKRQGTKSRWVGHRRCSGLYGELALGCGCGSREPQKIPLVMSQRTKSLGR